MTTKDMRSLTLEKLLERVDKFVAKTLENNDERDLQCFLYPRTKTDHNFTPDFINKVDLLIHGDSRAQGLSLLFSELPSSRGNGKEIVGIGFLDTAMNTINWQGGRTSRIAEPARR